MSDTSTAVAVQQPAQGAPVAPHRAAGLLRPIAPTGEIIAAQNDARAFIASALEKGRDYGVIPGTGNDRGGGDDANSRKPPRATLLKPGAERICAGFGVRADVEIVETEVDHSREVPWTKRKKKWRNRQFDGWETENGVSYGLYRYVVRVRLVLADSGVVVGEGIGSASTMESKYVDRPRDSENTVLKMAKKRAYIDAVLTTFGLSDQFTQDLDDFREEFTTEPGVDVQHASVAAAGWVTPVQLANLRAVAKENGSDSSAWLEEKIAAGIPEEDVPLVFDALRKQADLIAAVKRKTRPAPPPDEDEIPFG